MKNRIRVVTIGGGHGQSVLLRALVRLQCDITAIVTVADNGGCSGSLRETLGMPPPGDLRRCLSTLAENRKRAKLFEQRSENNRSRGNLFIASMWRRQGSLQAASDRAARWLGANGRVCPASETPCSLVGVTQDGRLLSGECEVAGSADPLMFLWVEGGEINPNAQKSLEEAEIIFLGPGSFYTSILACLLAPGIASAVVKSKARKVYVPNLSPEASYMSHFTQETYVRILQRHVEVDVGTSIRNLLIMPYSKRGKNGIEGPFDALKETGGIFASPSSSPAHHCPDRLCSTVHNWASIPFL